MFRDNIIMVYISLSTYMFYLDFVFQYGFLFHKPFIENEN